jgi:hypothetical protein
VSLLLGDSFTLLNAELNKKRTTKLQTLMLLPQTKVSEIRSATSAYTSKTFSKKAFKISLLSVLKSY